MLAGVRVCVCGGGGGAGGRGVRSRYSWPHHRSIFHHSLRGGHNFDDDGYIMMMDISFRHFISLIL